MTQDSIAGGDGEVVLRVQHREGEKQLLKERALTSTKARRCGWKCSSPFFLVWL